MYSPSHFSIQDTDRIRDFIVRNSFGIIVSHDGTGFHDTHAPLLVSNDLAVLSGHIAKANPQWMHWRKSAAVKVIFHGPHTYVSPRFYQSAFNVPTWNYTAVSIDGTVEIIEDRERCLRLMESLIAQYEGPEGWRMDANDERYLKMLDAIVCFEIRVEHLDAKFKLNQNKSAADRESVIAHLEKSADPMDQQVAAAMRM